MIVAVSGSQGCGKSTVVDELHKKGFDVIQRKTARSVLADWGMTLQQVNADFDLTTKYQDELFNRKVLDERVMDKHHLVFTERSYADLFSYALITLGKENRYSDWLNTYHSKCMYAQQAYSHIFYLKSGYFSTKHDGVRGSNHHYSRMADLIMADCTAGMTLSSKITTIDTGCLEQRVNGIMYMSEKLQQERRI